MKHLFIARHGEYDNSNSNDNGLTRKGVEDIERLAGKMKEIYGELRRGLCLFSSTALRAEQTAEIIAKAFDLSGFYKDERLFSDGEEDLPLEKLREIDRIISPHRKTYDATSLVSHWDIASSYSKHLLRIQLGIFNKEIDLSEGNAVHLDLEKKIYGIIP